MGNYIVMAILALVLFLGIRTMIQNKKKGKSCGCGGGCNGNCSGCGMQASCNADKH